MTTGLLTDRYELTMACSWLAEGRAQTPAVFEAFARRLPEGRQYGVVAGTGRLIEQLAGFRFDAEEVTWLSQAGVITPECADWLRDFRFTGDINGYREGDLYFPGSPVLTVCGELAQCAVLETLVLSVLNHDCAIAAAASRMADAAAGRSLIEMGSRRTHEQAAVAAARAAYLAGFEATSNLAAGRQFAVPTTGTAAHAFTLSHASEREAFAAQVKALGTSTTLLVDTYDITAGIAAAVEVAGPRLGGIRIDSGDPALTSRAARAQLDALGATGTRIVITGDLDEYLMTALADAPIDAYGVGSRLVAGSGHPSAGMVYKLVAVGEAGHPGAPLRPVAKTAAGKASAGGRKSAYRELDSAGHITRERLTPHPGGLGSHSPGPYEPGGLGAAFASAAGRPLQIPYLAQGRLVADLSLEAARAFHQRAKDELPAQARTVAQGQPFTSASF